MQREAEPDLFQIRETDGLTRLLLRPAQRGEKQRRENRDDGDDDQKFDQREAAPSVGRRLDICSSRREEALIRNDAVEGRTGILPVPPCKAVGTGK